MVVSWGGAGRCAWAGGGPAGVSACSHGNRGSVRTAASSFSDQLSRMSMYNGVSASSRMRSLMQRSPVRISARSIGRPTDTFERMVESSDTSAQRAASSSVVSARMMRSRMGLPYFDSPICR